MQIKERILFKIVIYRNLETGFDSAFVNGMQFQSEIVEQVCLIISKTATSHGFDLRCE
jgi:hypothetical protein